MSTGKIGISPAKARRAIVVAPAKINLFLHVGDTRADGYHALESLVAFAEIGDRLELTAARGISLEVTGPFGRMLARETNNLAAAAAKALASVASNPDLGVHIVLEKNLPLASGLGGGSADAAAALRALNGYWGLDLPEQDMLAIAAKLGSDVPACLLSQTCWMEGRGERVSRAPEIPSFPLVLINPGVAVPTGRIFSGLNARTGLGAISPPASGMGNVWDLVGYLAGAQNDLEAPACRFAPVIDEVLGAIDHEPGCVLAQMSGSGATCFGLFEEAIYAEGAADRIALEHPDWWVKETRIAAPGFGAPQFFDQ